MYFFKLISTLFKVNVQMAVAYRADAIINILLNLMWLGWELLGLSIIFSNTNTLGGWGFGELLALLGIFKIVHTMMMTLVWPNTEKFNLSIRDGSMDYTILQPVSSMFLVTFSRINIWRLWDIPVAATLIIIGINRAGDVTTAFSVLYFFLLIACGAVVIYSMWIAMIAFTFYFTKFDNNVTLLQALLEAGRYPVSVYPPWLQVIVTFIIPVAVATTIPVRALRQELGTPQTFMFVGIATASFLVASQIWKAGLKRYSGASS